MSNRCPHCGGDLTLLSEAGAKKLAKFVSDVSAAIDALYNRIVRLPLGFEMDYYNARRAAVADIKCLIYSRLDKRRTQEEVKHLLEGLEELHRRYNSEAVQATGPEARFFHTTMQLEMATWITRLKEVTQ